MVGRERGVVQTPVRQVVARRLVIPEGIQRSDLPIETDVGVIDVLEAQSFVCKVKHTLIRLYSSWGLEDNGQMMREVFSTVSVLLTMKSSFE